MSFLIYGLITFGVIALALTLLTVGYIGGFNDGAKYKGGFRK